MDYAICKASEYNTSDGMRLLPILIIYNIVCQWWINFRKRVQGSMTLNFSEFRHVMVAVGKFHLGAHIKSCFWKYSLNFIEGSGQIDGEIMETLWALFNKFARMGRAMTRAHRWELLNDHMQDVNHKKMVGMGSSTVHSANFKPHWLTHPTFSFNADNKVGKGPSRDRDHKDCI